MADVANGSVYCAMVQSVRGSVAQSISVCGSIYLYNIIDHELLGDFVAEVELVNLTDP